MPAFVYTWPFETILRNNGEPIEPSDAATKNYVDTNAARPSGNNGTVQFNDNGALGGTNILTVQNAGTAGVQPTVLPQGSLDPAIQANIVTLVYGNGKYIAGGGTTTNTYSQLYLASSTNGNTWTLTYAQPGPSVNSAKYISSTDQFIYGVNTPTGGLAYSSSANTQAFTTIPGSGSYVQDVDTDSNGSWISVYQSTPTRTGTTISYIGKTVTAANAAISSPATFTTQYTGNAGVNNLNSVTWHAAGNVFVAVGDGGIALRSTDSGNTWSPATTGVTNTLNRVISAGNSIVAVGANGTVITSTSNGTSWTTANVGSITDNITGVSYNSTAGRIVAVTATGPKVISSTDGGATWTTDSSLPLADSSYGAIYLSNSDDVTLGGSLTQAGNLYAIATFAFGASGANAMYANIDGFKIPGGANGQVLTTDGAGNLSWTDSGSGTNQAIPAIHFDVAANGNGQSFSNVYLLDYVSNVDITAFLNGVLVENTDYTLTGNTITFNVALNTGDNIDIVRQVVAETNIQALPIPRISFTVTSNGAGQTFTDSNITYYTSEADMSLYVNGVLSEETAYSVSGNAVTVDQYLVVGDTVDITRQFVATASLSSLFIPRVHFDVTSNGANQSFSNDNLSYYAGANTMTVFVNGVLDELSDYTLVGPTLTIRQNLSVGDTIDVTQQFLSNTNVANVYAIVIPPIHFTANANGNNQTFTSNVLNSYNSSTDLTLFYNGAYLESEYYSLSGNTLTMNVPVFVGDNIDIARQFVSNTSVDVNAVVIPPIHFTANANGNNQTFTSNTFNSYSSNTELTLFYNGVYLQSTYYTLSGNTLTMNVPVFVGDNIDVARQFVPIDPYDGPAGGANTQIQFNSGGLFAGSANFTFVDGVNGGTVGGTSNITLAPTGNVVLPTVSRVKMAGGANGGILVTDGASNLSFPANLNWNNGNGILTVASGINGLGDFTLRAPNGAPNTVNLSGNSITISAGTAGDGNGSGGTTTVRGGGSGNEGQGGNVVIEGGTSYAGVGGTVSIAGGSTDDANGWTGNGGPVTITGGNANGANKAGGNVNIVSSTGANGAINGVINISGNIVTSGNANITGNTIISGNLNINTPLIMVNDETQTLIYRREVNANSANSFGGTLTIQGALANGVGVPGNLVLEAGSSPGIPGISGRVFINGGNTSGNVSTGGPVFVNGGTGNVGGNVFINGGNGATRGGNVVINGGAGGNGANLGGNVIIDGGSTGGNSPGYVFIGGNSYSVTLTTGNTTGSNFAGPLYIESGVGANFTYTGNINIGSRVGRVNRINVGFTDLNNSNTRSKTQFYGLMNLPNYGSSILADDVAGGDMYYNTVDGQFYGFNGILGDWQPLTTPGGLGATLAVTSAGPSNTILNGNRFWLGNVEVPGFSWNSGGLQMQNSTLGQWKYVGGGQAIFSVSFYAIYTGPSPDEVLVFLSRDNADLNFTQFIIGTPSTGPGGGIVNVSGTVPMTTNQILSVIWQNNGGTATISQSQLTITRIR